MKNLSATVLLLCVACCCYGQADTDSAARFDIFEVYFDLRETTLNNKAVMYIDSLIKTKVLKPGQPVSLVGYADYRGTGPHNDTVSFERAKNVKLNLDTKGIAVSQYVGMGKVDRPGMTGADGYAPDRKVQIIVQRPATTVDIDNVKVNETINLKNIFFAGNLPDILPSSLPELENLFQVLDANNNVTIQIEGHACCKDFENMVNKSGISDQRLSEQRAKAIYEYLFIKGISETRMKYVGYGITRPLVYPARTEAEQLQNRRVEIRVLSK